MFIKGHRSSKSNFGANKIMKNCFPPTSGRSLKTCLFLILTHILKSIDVKKIPGVFQNWEIIKAKHEYSNNEEKEEEEEEEESDLCTNRSWQYL